MNTASPSLLESDSFAPMLIESKKPVDESKTSLLESKKFVSSKKKLFSLKYYRELNRYFGAKLLTFLGINYFAIKGMLDQAMYEVSLPLVKNIGHDSQDLLLVHQAHNIPWSIKGPIGLISDLFPLFGYHKRSYMIVIATLSIIFNLILVAVPPQTLGQNFWIVTLGYIIIPLTPSAFDLLCEGKYTQIMIDYPQTKADIVSFVWFWQYVGRILNSAYIGTVSQEFGYIPILSFNFLLLAIILVLSVFNFICDEKVEKSKRNRIDFAKARHIKIFVILGILIGIAQVGTSFVTQLLSVTGNFIYIWTIAIIVMVAEYFILPKALANCNSYMFFSHAVTPSLSSAIEFWYTGNEQCVPNGPHFSLVYFKTITPLIGAVASLVAVVFFQAFMSSWSFRRVQLVAGIAVAVAACNDYIILRRWNINYLKIPDKAMYIVGDAIVQPMVYMFIFLPGCILLSRVCPRTIESTVYAIFAGFANFGNVAAASTGRFLLQSFNVLLTENGPCSYDALPMLYLITNSVCLLCFIPIALLILPGVSMAVPLTPEELDLQNTILNKYAARKDPETAEKPTSECLELEKVLDKEKKTASDGSDI